VPTDVEILRAARERIATPGRWCRSHLAVGKDGRPTAADWEDACSWCALGAIAAHGLHVFDQDALEIGAADWLRRVLPSPYGSVARFNDDPAITHADVMALYDAAIKLAEAEADRG